MGKPTCPSCESTYLRRSRRRNLLERVGLRLFSIRPYRCLDCDRRFYRRTRRYLAGRAEVSARWSGLALTVFFAVPLVLGAQLVRHSVLAGSSDGNPPAVAAPVPLPIRLEPPIPSVLKPELRPAFSPREKSGEPLFHLQGGVQRTPVGALTVTGPVLLSGTPITGETTVFVGDVIRTGPDGAARITVAGNGTLILSGQTELSLSGAPRYLTTLRAGVLGIQSLEGARNFQVRVGNYLVVPAPDAPAVAEIRLAPDGSAQITCQSGSVGVIALEGEEVLFLRPGQTAGISATGTLMRPEARPAEPPPPAPQAERRKKRGVIFVILAGGGAAGAALALAGGKKEARPVSPSVP